MPEMSTKFVPKHKGDKNPNPKLLKFVHLDFPGDAVRDVTDEFQQFRVRVFVAFVLGDKLG